MRIKLNFKLNPISEDATQFEMPTLYYCLSISTGVSLTLVWSMLYSALNVGLSASHILGEVTL